MPDTAEADLGRRFAAALAAKDAGELRRMMTDDVIFRGMTPGRFWEGAGPAEVSDILFANWFEDQDHIEELSQVQSGRVMDRNHISYRVLVRTPDGPHLVEQQAYFDVENGRISWMSVLCSGFRALSDEA